MGAWFVKKIVTAAGKCGDDNKQCKLTQVETNMNNDKDNAIFKEHKINVVMTRTDIWRRDVLNWKEAYLMKAESKTGKRRRTYLQVNFGYPWEYFGKHTAVDRLLKYKQPAGTGRWTTSRYVAMMWYRAVDETVQQEFCKATEHSTEMMRWRAALVIKGWDFMPLFDGHLISEFDSGKCALQWRQGDKDMCQKNTLPYMLKSGLLHLRDELKTMQDNGCGNSNDDHDIAFFKYRMAGLAFLENILFGSKNKQFFGLLKEAYTKFLFLLHPV